MNQINAVRMVREIRDREYEKTKTMTREEFLDYINESSLEAFKQFVQLTALVKQDKNA